MEASICARRSAPRTTAPHASAWPAAELAANTLFDLGHEIRAIADLVDDVSDQRRNSTLSTCVRTMLPEMYRQIDEAVRALGHRDLAGFVDSYDRKGGAQ
jgi:hypothetical protein